MTDATQAGAFPSGRPGTHSRDLVRASLGKRKSAQTRLKIYGGVAIAFALLMLATLIGSVVSTSLPAWTRTEVKLDVAIPAEDDINFNSLANNSLLAMFPETDGRAERRAVTGILSNGAQFMLRDLVAADPQLKGQTTSVWVPVSDPYEQLFEGVVNADQAEANRRLDDAALARFKQLEEAGLIRSSVDWGLVTEADSRFPELAGLKGAIIGSFFLLLVCFLISVPVGVGAAVYLEEFAPKNRFTDFIEININNLAAVPSIVFGLLGLALFIGVFGLPRSVPLVGGMVLSLMTLPTIIIVTRNALKAVPPSIREAARGVGASEMQVIGHHVLPLALPGILTGVIIGLAQALGEAAPLLLIGMNAFITSAPSGPLDPSTALPTQIFIWFDSPERGFVARTSAAICVLLAFLSIMNLTAVLLRRRLERRW
ncbi:phosphate ABC transporter permease PstA [Aurantimonas coralicida]|uniref:phosphate ABC transporter permease PstA n=1 Tax=Aurantimonas coralicida TaxID=182270 RepID=UPI001D197D21|nr:phosphate ABC transporter permease PstA [Aurantimonas coralicida]MCC4298236.1 phosphate ABC transporter permease PstA [Aurantimonas coralicida]